MLFAMSSQIQNPNQNANDAAIFDYKSPAMPTVFRYEDWEKVSIDDIVDKVVVIHGYEERPSRYGDYMVVYAEHEGRKIRFVLPRRHGRELENHLRMLWYFFKTGNKLRARIIKEWYRDFYRYTLGVPPTEQPRPDRTPQRSSKGGGK
jgi:hypothetical protein